MIALGILFLLMGFYLILSEIYTSKRIDGELVFFQKEREGITEFFKFKILMGIFSLVLRVFSLINNLIY